MLSIKLSRVLKLVDVKKDLKTINDKTAILRVTFQIT